LINLTLENDALIILSHNYSPNWKLKDNKENVGILMRNRNFMAFYGKKGVNEIDFFYSDPLIKTGLGIWVLSGIILLLFSIFYYFKKITIA
nr:hypothetical protein [Candidatus Dependentiae bacterium]